MLQLPLVLPPQRRVLRGNLDSVAAWKENHVAQVRNPSQKNNVQTLKVDFQEKLAVARV
jgi:hypothetical protein